MVREKMNTQHARRRITRNYGVGSVDAKIINASNMFYTSGALQVQKLNLSQRAGSNEVKTRAETRSNFTESRIDKPIMRGKSLDYKMEIKDMIQQDEQFGINGYFC